MADSPSSTSTTSEALPIAIIGMKKSTLPIHIFISIERFLLTASFLPLILSLLPKNQQEPESPVSHSLSACIIIIIILLYSMKKHLSFLLLGMFLTITNDDDQRQSQNAILYDYLLSPSSLFFLLLK